MTEYDEREEELTSLSAIYPELKLDPSDAFAAALDLAVTPTKPLLVRFIPAKANVSPQSEASAMATTTTATGTAAYVERDVHLAHLPPLTLRVTLPQSYPSDTPPVVRLATQHDWLPAEKIHDLEGELKNLWEDYGGGQILFAYIDFLQQAAERGFDLDQSAEGCLVLPVTAEMELVGFDTDTAQAIFDAGTFDCEICLEPKKGSSCHQVARCGHVFCRQCLQDFYNNAIKEGDVAGVKCLSPDCGKEEVIVDGRKRKRQAKRSIQPRELLVMGIEEGMVRRYVEMKHKKKLEADKSTVYCPRTWCQGPARSAKYPPIPADLSTYVSTESSDEESDTETAQDKHGRPPSRSARKPAVKPNPNDRLAVCEKCELAFCTVCYKGWHGPFARCYPRNPNELSEEEKASYEYIQRNTSPCPTCSSPTQKTMGCNHMCCFQCGTHFCYLCGSWLDGQNPYAHFNKVGTECFQLLWELEEGDEGQDPQDGRGFGGLRRWEAVAADVARAADAEEAAVRLQVEEAEEAAAEMQEEEDERMRAAEEEELVLAMAAAQLRNQHVAAPAPQPRARRRRNPHPNGPMALGAAQAVRAHERNQQPPPRQHGEGFIQVVVDPLRVDLAAQRRERAEVDQMMAGLRAEELQRFVAMADRDEEDEWDSDDLGDDEGLFVIR